MPRANTQKKSAKDFASNGHPPAALMAKRLGLRHVSSDTLTIRRRRQGKGWSYLNASGRVIRDPAVVRRLARLAVPPAYDAVLYAADPAAHLQAVGRDAAGRLQYRYHPDWEKVREQRKARRLAHLAETLPRIRRSIGQHLAGSEPTRALALSAVIELVGCSAIRPGREAYLQQRGTRGAATLLKSSIAVDGDRVALRFRGKGGKIVAKEFKCPRLIGALECLHTLPGPRLFQYRADNGTIARVRARDVNAFLREIADTNITLKDFRTLIASASILETLVRITPARSERQRKKQVLQAIRAVAQDLHNTPAICRRSYVHGAVIAAFEDGVLERFSEALAGCRSPTKSARVLAAIVAPAAA
jgi:DNA topoisomerase-1